MQTTNQHQSEYRRYYAVFLTTVITESYRVKSLVSPLEMIRKVARLSNIHAPKRDISLGKSSNSFAIVDDCNYEIFHFAKVAILL